MTSDFVSGGFFDGKTGADERRQYLLDLFKRSAQQEATVTGLHTLSNAQVLTQLPLSSFLLMSAVTHVMDHDQHR